VKSGTLVLVPRRFTRPLCLAVALSCALSTLTRAGAAAEDAPDDASSEDASAARASDAKHAPPAAENPAKDASLGHRGQFGLRAGLVLGYRMILRYGSSPYCVAPDPNAPADPQKFCGHGAPLAADFGLSFGVLDFLEPFAWARLGFGPEKETDTKALVVLGAGVRIYTLSDAAFKLFIEPAVGVELEGGRGTPAWQTNQPDYKQDFMFHVAAGPELDLSRNIGLYLAAGVSADVLRALGSSLDLNLGLQGRAP
jgi:hypothetical protein